MTDISQNFGKLLEPTLRKVFLDKYGTGIDMIPMLFNVQMSEKAEEHDLGIVGSGLLPKVTGGSVTSASDTQGYEVTYHHEEYAKIIGIERKLFDDDMYGVMSRRASNLAIDAFKTRQYHGGSLFNNAFDTSVVSGGDGLALCASAHTSPASTLQGTQSNLGSSALGVSALNSARQAMMEFKGDDGQPANVVPDMLIVGTSNGEKAIELCKSINIIDSANNNVNTNNVGIPGYQIKPVIWNQISGDKWFLVDSMLMKEYLLWFDRVPVEFKSAENFSGLLAEFMAYMRFSFGFSDWRWVYGSNPS